MNTKPLRDRIQFGHESESLNRPAWTQYDQHAYRHKHTTDKRGRFLLLRDYYVRSGGCR